MFFLTRDARALLGIFPGEGISLKTTFFSSVFILVPLGALVGGQFSLAFSLFPGARAASGYIWESIGCFAGGLLFTYVLLPYNMEASAIVLLLAALFTAAAAAVSGEKLRHKLFAASIIMMFVLPWSSNILKTQV